MSLKVVVGVIAGLALLVGASFFFLRKPPPQVSPALTTQPTISMTQETPKMRKTYSAPPAMGIDTAKSYRGILKTTKGAMIVTLFAKENPITVNNFVFLAREGFYDGTPFHRIIKGFMVQGGDPKGDGTGSPGYRFNDEPITRSYTRGTIAMANSGPNTNGSQFFIMHADYPLSKDYVIFGAIDAKDVESLATLDAIAQTPVVDDGRGEASKPTQTILVESIAIEEQ